MSAGLGLLKAIMTADDLSIFGRLNITSKLFRTVDETAVFSFVEQYLIKFGMFPSMATIKVETAVDLSIFPDEPVEYWLEIVRHAQTKRELHRLTEQLQTAVQSDNLTTALTMVAEFNTGQLNAGNGHAIKPLRELAMEVIDAHDLRQQSPDMLGVPLGFSVLDKMTDGAQGGDLIVVLGRPSKGKTYFLMQMLHAAHLAGNSVLMVSYEMSAFQNARRYLGLASGISVTDIKLGRVGYFGREKLRQIANGEYGADYWAQGRGLREDVRFDIITGSMHSTVEDLYFIARQFRPAVIGVDAAYLAQTKKYIPTRFERVTSTCEYLKFIAQDLEIPVYATYQFKRGTKDSKGDIDDIYMSDAIGQIASIAIGIDDDSENDETDRYLRWKQVNLIKGREGETAQFRVLYDMENMRIREERDENEYYLSQGVQNYGYTDAPEEDPYG